MKEISPMRRHLHREVRRILRGNSADSIHVQPVLLPSLLQMPRCSFLHRRAQQRKTSLKSNLRLDQQCGWAR